MAETRPWPYTTPSSPRLPRMNYRPPLPGGDPITDEINHRAEIERSLQRGDDALAQIERRLLALEEAVAALQSP